MSVEKLFSTAGDSRKVEFVSDAVINLYAAGILSLLYPYKHPLITDPLRNAFHSLQKAFRTKSHLHLETAGGKLILDGEVLDSDVLVFEYFTSWLNSRNIKALTFARDLTRRELIVFHRIISTQNLTIEELSKAMSEKSVVNVIVDPMKFTAGDTGVAAPNDTTQKGFIRDYESTMYHMEKSQAQAPFFVRPAKSNPLEDTARYGRITDHESTMHQPEIPTELSRLSKDSNGKDSIRKASELDHYADSVEALLESNISEDQHDVILSIPPHEMAHLLNTMLFGPPGADVVDRVIRAYFGETEGMREEDAVERCRIFLAKLKTFLQPSFLSRCAPLFNTYTLLPDQAEILSELSQGIYKPSGTENDSDMPPEQPVSVPCRTIEGSDFSFDFVYFGKAVLHDIEISKETASLFNEEHIAHFSSNKNVLDAVSTSVPNASVDEEFQASIIAECTDEAINEASFDVLLELLESDLPVDDAYQKLEGRLAGFVELYLEKAEFEKVIDLFNSLKTQSLQGKRSEYASTMIRRIFSSDKINTKIVYAIRQHGRKHRDIAFKLTSALRSFIIPRLLDALSEESDASTRRFIMSLLTSVRSEATDHIAKRLSDRSWYIVRNMLYLLKECRGWRYTSAVREFLEHEEPLVRLEALRTLLAFQDPEADRYMKKFLFSKVFQLQKGAVRLTGAYRLKYAVPHLVRLLQEKDGRGKKLYFKRMIVRALGRIGDSRAIRHLLNICMSTSGLRKSEFDKLKTEIFKTLHNYPAAVIVPLIDFGMHSTNEEIASISKKLMKRYGPFAGKQG